MSHIMKYSYYSFIFLYFTFFDFALHQILPFNELLAFVFYYVMLLAALSNRLDLERIAPAVFPAAQQNSSLLIKAREEIAIRKEWRHKF